jgi:DNA-3-methyladenine glycosylase
MAAEPTTRTIATVPDERMSRAALAAWSIDLAPVLLGARLVSEAGGERVAVRLTEVEAYMGERDPGSHAFRGRTPRTAVMFGPAGHLYVYFTYGMHWCANVVCGPDGTASAVLLRAGEVVEGLDVARARRPAARRDVDLARGPARLATVLALDGTSTGVDLCAEPASGVGVWLEAAATNDRRGAARVVRTGPRVGVSGAGGSGEAYPWRFWLDGEPTVSDYRPGQPRRRRAPRPGTMPAAPPQDGTSVRPTRSEGTPAP